MQAFTHVCVYARNEANEQDSPAASVDVARLRAASGTESRGTTDSSGTNLAWVLGVDTAGAWIELNLDAPVRVVGLSIGLVVRTAAGCLDSVSNQ